MNKETLEHISSLMDGELSRETGLFLTRRLSADRELCGTWERYHLIRDCMRQPGGNIPLVDLSQRMRDALSEEQAEPATALASRRWMKPVAGLAVAVSVALMAVVAIGPGQPLQGPDPTASTAQPFTSPNILPAIPETQAASFSPQTQDSRLNSYLLRHNQSIGSISSQGFLGYVPMISTAETEDPIAEEEPAVEEDAVDAVSGVASE
jgi:sigma-E factor negative regulatory protein RseA